ncbi:MAG: HerA-ATP synthase, barrel protein, partial [Capsulimonas sp.]|nr:HerA-ATP synthase, barrel protein [Capsulimonas sp.]
GYEDEEELRAQQPQIFELLRTEFSGLLIAYSDGDKGLRRHLPPRSPRVHSRVYPCTDEEIRVLTSDLSFLRGLLNGSGALGGAPTDELVAACLRQAAPAQLNEQAFLLRAGKTLAGFLSEDYDRLQAILRSIV